MDRAVGEAMDRAVEAAADGAVAQAARHARRACAGRSPRRSRRPAPGPLPAQHGADHRLLGHRQRLRGVRAAPARRVLALADVDAGLADAADGRWRRWRALVSERAARRAAAGRSRWSSLVDGVVGFVYHLRGIQRLPGGFRLGQYNVVMGPPIFAPLLTCMVGVLGPAGRRCCAASALRPAVARRAPRSLALDALAAPTARRSCRSAWPRAIAHGRFQRGMALTSAVFAVLAGGEAYFEHLRGSFNQRLMWTPIWVTPPMVAGRRRRGAAASASRATCCRSPRR